MASDKVNWDAWVECADVTDIGMRRSNNQDSHLIALASDMEHWRRQGHMFIVADGMGAHAAGELASGLAVERVPHHYQKYTDLSPPQALQKAIVETNADVHRRGQANSEFHNMGTTTSVLVLLPQGALIGHIGDSRIYRLRGQQLDQMTFDHSLVWELKRAGQLSAEAELGGAIPKNVITRSLGPNASIQVDIEGPFPIEVGDTFLLCSDGLSGQVTDDEIGSIMAHLPPGEAARVLVDLANLRGGPDNSTVIIVKVQHPDMSSQVSGQEPLVLSSSKKVATVHPIVWVVAGVLLLVAIALFIAGDATVPALIAAAGGAVALLYGVIQKARNYSHGISLRGRTLGKGPYTTLACPANRQFVAKLASVVQELKDAADDREWSVDWEGFSRHCQSAERFAGDKQYGDALREYARAVSFMMDEFRSQQTRKARDSALD